MNRFLTKEEVLEFELLKLKYDIDFKMWDEAKTDEECKKYHQQMRADQKRLDELRYKAIDLLPTDKFSEETKNILRKGLISVVRRDEFDKIIMNSYKPKKEAA